ncbi:MAG: flagellar assembly protein FliW [Polyangiaceae bacterium]|nr:flagellar assembly protein FliW [Myxococcales bacterium]MCB9587323.1 flagellar assembly protein FliW [Polyangiaceae bacterium]MCB9605881.1 flagellar assembly protein FliW [Polyangiaceae bacterium]
MIIESQRFGTIECSEEDVINFPAGIIGFPDDTQYILLQHKTSSAIGWLQSTTSAHVSLPVVSAHGLAPEYPDVPVGNAARGIGLEGEEGDFAVLAVLCARSGLPATVNLLAPIVINAATRTGGQVFLDGSRFTTRELFVMPAAEVESASDDTQDAAPELAEAATP